MKYLVTTNKIKASVALATIVVMAGLSSSLKTEPASAYSTYRNWYSMTWVFNKSETYQIAWVMSSPANTQSWGISGPPSWAMTVYWNLTKQIARQARSRNGCLAIYWQYVNIPVPEMYWGAGCF